MTVSKSVIIADIFLYWEMDLLHIFNIIKNMTHVQNNNAKSQNLGILLQDS